MVKRWHYVISPRGKAAWVNDGKSGYQSPPWVGDTGWHGVPHRNE
jgi:hypothetical protein